jgi:iduronate 2-sulfatase
MKSFEIKSRKNIILSTYFLFVLFLFSCSPKKTVRPNILFIAADDLNTDIGCYGINQVKTPNLDRLAKMGVRFNNAYAQQALCGPSRASIMSGLRPNTTGFVNLNDNLRRLKPDVVTYDEKYIAN